MSIFGGKREKRVPETLNDCIRPDGLSLNLRAWAQRTEKIGQILLVCLVIIGIIDTVSIGVTTYQELNIMGNASDEAVVATCFAIIGNILWFVLYILIEYGIFRAIALLIAALARIVENTTISANLKIYKAKINFPQGFTEEIETENIHIAENTAVQNPDTAKDVIDEGWYEKIGIDPNVLNYKSKQKNVVVIEEQIYTDIVCPNCKKTVSVSENTSIACPLCNAVIDTSNIKKHKILF